MLDIYVASALFDAVKPGCQVVLIGDADQLPSVGPGAVLSEMIASGCVPVVRLDKVYRQREGSRIAINAKLIRHGNLALEYGSDFQFVNSPQLPDSAEIMVQLYLQEVRRCGVDNVALLTPYRQKTETSVNALNQRLRDLLNPPMPGKAEVSCGSRVFRCGDKVMQTRNFRDVSNGDIGYSDRGIRPVHAGPAGSGLRLHRPQIPGCGVSIRDPEPTDRTLHHAHPASRLHRHHPREGKGHHRGRTPCPVHGHQPH